MPTVGLYDSMLFNYESTGRTDFQEGHVFRNEPKTVYKAKVSSPKRSPLQIKDNHTLSVWKDKNIPFDLFIKPNEIIRSDLEKIQIESTKPVVEIKESDEVRKNVQATRPRLVISPALSMDDIENPRARKILIEDLYKSTVQKMQQEVYSGKDCSYRAPLDGRLTAAVPITLPKVKVPYVAPEWRMEAVSWDRRKVRGYADPTKEFWLKTVPMCHACDVTEAVITQRKAMKTRK